MLRNEVRRSVLGHLGSQAAIASVLQRQTERGTDAVQQMLDGYILGEAPPLEAQTLEQLTATVQVAGWLAGLSAPLPSVEEVRSHMEWRRLLQPFRNLAGVHFQGRRVELERLRNYVGVLPPGSVAALVRRQPWTVLDFYARPPMVIHGPGGSGKSTLIARFLLEHAELPDPERFPFAYLDFDRVGLAPEEPLSLLAEIYRQLGAQYPTWKQELDVARAALVQRLRRTGGAAPAFASPGADSVPSLSSFTEREHAIALLARLLDDLGAREKPFLLVLDTFEEVQYRGPDYVHEVRHFLELLERSVPRLRTVLASRASVREFPNEPMPLGTLDPEAADAFLAARGVADPDERSALRRLVGDSPLSLELAAQVMRVEGSVVSGLAGGRPQALLPFQLTEAQIHGHLYRRILEHIHNPEVRRLAHPGLVLRRVTPALIRDVLAEPCGVEVPDNARARELWASSTFPTARPGLAR